MVLQNEFDVMFETLDASCRGFLSDNEIQSFYASLFGKHVHHVLVKYVLKRFGGTDKESECIKKCFENVLFKIEEIKTLEESVYWDFMSLDQNGSHLVSPKNGYFLAREMQNRGFPLMKWQDWMNSRNNPTSPISWCEFQQYIYTIPGSGTNEPTSIDDDSFENEVSSFEMQEAEETNSKYGDLKEILDDELYLAQLAEEQQEYLNSVSYESSRLLNRWNVNGVEAVIWDDGTEMEMVEKAPEKRDTISIDDLVTAINIKYDLLRERIMRDMASFHAGHTTGLGEDIEDVLMQIKEKEKKLRHFKNREDFNPVWVTGEIMDKYPAKWKEMDSTSRKLRAEGKSSMEIHKILEDETLANAKGIMLGTDVLQYITSRQKEETEYLLKSLQGSTSSAVAANRTALYSSIHRQCLRAEIYEIFELSAMWACLAERSQLSDFERYSPDHSRQEKISFELLKKGAKERKGQNVPNVVKLTNVSHSKNLSVVDSWLEVTRLMAQKHSSEREMMMHFLLNGNYQEQVAEMKQQTKKELLDMKKTLTKEHDNWNHCLTSGGVSKDEKAEKRVYHLSILSKAAAVYHTYLAKDLGEEHHLTGKILGRLQVLQDIESEKLFEQMKSMTVGDIFKLRKEIYRSTRDELFDNISALVFGVVQLSPEEEELVAIIMSKYDKLRTKMFENFVNKQNLKNDIEKQTMLEKICVAEAKNRNAGNHSKLSRLAKDTFKITYPLQEVAGPLVSQFASEAEYYLEDILESGRKRKLINEPAVGDSKKAEDNVLSEIGIRCEDEVETILESLRSADPKEKPVLIAAEIGWQQWEMMHFNLDKEFSQAVTAMGLCGRMRTGQGRLRLRQDNKRYASLVQERLAISPILNIASLQATASKTTATQSSLRRVLLCHASEWRKLQELLSDSSAEELRDAAAMMTEDERVTRLAEINSKRLALDMKSDGWQEDLVSLLEEASAIKYVTRMQNLKELSGGTIEVNDFDVIASIMADLQEEHDLNGVGWFQKAIQDPNVAGNIKDLVVAESKSCVNIFNVLCRYDGQTDDDKILQALDDKYDSLRDKLLAEALMRQLGDKRWNEMSERERQEYLMKLKLMERKLRRQGKFDELSKLLGDAADDDARLRALLGMNREEYDRKLKERLAMRKRGHLAGIEEEDDVEENKGDILTDLANRYEDEKNALLRLLQGQGDRYMSERDRQKELARLRHQLQKSQREERFGAAALVLGLTERNARMEKRLESDKKRQEELAKQRIAALKSKVKGNTIPMMTISEEDENILTDGTKEEMMDAVLSKLELLHESERAWLLYVANSQSEVASLKNLGPVKLAKTNTALEISDRLDALDLKLTDKHVNIHQSRIELSEASFYRQALIAHKEQDITEEDKDKLDVKIMALLQEVQDAKSLQLTEEMLTMSEEKLIEIQETFLSWVKKGLSENIPTALLGATDTDTVIEEALNGRFEAILAALVEKSLIDKHGEAKWNSLSQQDKDELIADMMSKIKKLMAEGKTDEASALLGQSINDNPELLALFGGNSEEEERARLEEERLKRKQERMKNGMSEEEADELMRQEAEADEEMLRQRRRNILENLKYDIDAQRAALLRQLDDANARLKEDRIRQLELAKLRLQERLMRRDNDLEAVAHLVSLSRLQADQLESEKERQRELARKRLELYRQGKSRIDDADSILKLPQGDDVEILIDAIMKEMESKHAHERLALIKMMTETASPGTQIHNTISSMNGSGMAKKLSELRELRRLWRNDDPVGLKENASEQMDILNEATAINLEMAKENEDSREEDLQVVLLANLQNQQMLETEHLLNGLPGKNPATLRAIAKVQWQAKSDGWLDNVAESLLKKEKTSLDEDEVIKALEDKYDAMKDKLIAEALMKELGEKEWNLLSEQERQRKILMLKMKERKLKQEGKLDEAAQLFASMLQSEEDVSRLLGEAKLSQEEKLKQRLEKQQKLKEERLAAGLSVDDDILETELDKEEEAEKREKRKNVLLLLEHNLDEEREALLANLRRQDELVGSERRRQLELARLRREQRQIAREDRWNAAAIVFNQAKKSEEMLAASIEANRARQLELAKERLAARKMRKQEKEAAGQLFDAAAIAQKLKIEEEEIKDASLSAPEYLMQELEKKQMKEREMFYLLLLAADMDEKMKKEITNLETEKIEVEQKKLRNQREEWREQRFVDLLQGKEGEDKTKINEKRISIAEGIVQQNENFKRHILLSLEAYKRQSEESIDFADAKNKLSVEWLAEVQSAQDSAVDAVHTLISDKSDEVLDMITFGQKRARMEDWNDNITKVTMGILPPGQAPLQSEDRQPSFISVGSEERAVEDAEKKIESLDEELEFQKKELERQKRVGEIIDLDAEMSKLEQEHSAQKQALYNDLERQRKRAKERLLTKKRQREEMEYEAHAAAAMVVLAERRLEMEKNRSSSEKSRQRSIMEERLEARKKKRQMLQEQEARKEEEETSKPSGVKKTPSMPPPRGLEREKTVIEVNVSEKDKEKVLKELQEISEANMKIMMKEKERQQKKIIERLERARDKTVSSQANKLIKQFQREKTLVMESKNKDLERQKTILQDRVRNIRIEKTMTMKQKGDKKVHEFEKLLSQEETQALSKDEKMKLAAESLQKKLMADASSQDVKLNDDANVTDGDAGHAGTSETPDNDKAASIPTNRMSTKRDKEKILKQRMEKRKLQKQEMGETDGNPQE